MEPTFMEQVLPVILTTASGLVVLIVGWGVKILGAYIANKTKNENLIVAFDTLAEIIDTTVKDLEQTFKAAAADGKFTDDEKRVIKAKALGMVDKQLPEFVKSQIAVGVNDLQGYVDSKIEAIVLEMKEK